MSAHRDEESHVPVSIFRVKSGAEPFIVCGVKLEGDDAIDEIDGNDHSTRIFLQQSVFAQREKFCAELDSASVCSDLRDLMKLERKKNKSSTASMKKKYRKAEVSAVDLIRTGLANVHVILSRIFQTLLVFLDTPTPPPNLARVGHPEIETASRRSREFDVRLKRIAFELRKKVGQTRSALTKLQIHPENSKLRAMAENKLYQSIRCALSLLNSYLRFLPHAVKVSVYPGALRSAVDQLEAVAAFTERLNFDPGEFGKDVKCLRVVVERFHDELVKKPYNGAATGSRAAALNNLAREQCGPSSKTVINSKIKKSKQLLQTKSTLKRALSMQSPEKVPQSRQTAVLDLADHELSHILACRSPGMSLEAVGENVSFAADFTIQIVEELVGTVCREMFLDDIVEKILKLELRE